MIKLKIDNVEYKITEEEIENYRNPLSDVATATGYGAAFDGLWSRITEMAAEWTEYPDEYTSYDGYADLLTKLATLQNIWPAAQGVSPQTADLDGAQVAPADASAQNVAAPVAELLVAFKRVWAEISMDPTEGGMPSDYLASKSVELHDVLTKLVELQEAKMLNKMIPAIFNVSNKFLAGGYKCHQDAAKEIRNTLQGYPFAANHLETPPNQREQQLGQEWETLVFSTRI